VYVPLFLENFMGAAYRTANATAPAHGAVLVTASDSTVFPITRSLYIGTGGNLSVHFPDQNQNVLFTNVPAGIFPIQVDMVYATTGGTTTASNIVALY
jgi:hypothetical protein